MQTFKTIAQALLPLLPLPGEFGLGSFFFFLLLPWETKSTPRFGLGLEFDNMGLTFSWKVLEEMANNVNMVIFFRV
jgi:hypothetical protein